MTFYVYIYTHIIMSETITLTFGDCGENHTGMQQIGKMAEKGISFEEIKGISERLRDMGVESEIIDLSAFGEKACVLVVREGISKLCNFTSSKIFDEQMTLNWDKKAFMKGRVVNKHARYNLCFDEKGQEPLYDKKKGRIIAWNDVPFTRVLKEKLEELVGIPLIGEGNMYYDKRKCGIGYHGDTERRVVIGCRLGASMNLRYHWFYKSKPVGDFTELIFHHGDFYIMSEKAVGFDWKRRNTHTLRHSAGCSKFTEIKQKRKE
jgi:hypothetical protein